MFFLLALQKTPTHAGIILRLGMPGYKVFHVCTHFICIVLHYVSLLQDDVVYLCPFTAKLLGNRTVAISSFDGFDDLYFQRKGWYLVCPF